MLRLMSVENKRETWKTIINVVISILTALATTLGLTLKNNLIFI